MGAKTKVICFANNKGGSGKSTTCSNVGYGLTQLGRKVLLIDGDMQLNLSLSLFDEDTVLGFAQGGKNIYEGIRRQDDLTDYIVHTAYENLDLIPSSTLMSSIEYELFTKWQREYILKKGLKSVIDSGVYDYILIDCNPSLGLLLTNVLVASNQVIIPVQTQYFATQGLSSLEGVIGNVRMTLNADLTTVNILLTFKDKTSVATAVTETLREQYPQSVFATEITRKQEAINSSMMGKPAGGDTGAEYRALADELIAREG